MESGITGVAFARAEKTRAPRLPWGLCHFEIDYKRAKRLGFILKRKSLWMLKGGQFNIDI